MTATTAGDVYETKDLWNRSHYETPAEKARFEAVLAALPTDATSLLDVGAGNGAFLSLLEHRRPTLLLEGLEPSREARQAAVCRTALKDGSIAALQRADRSVDVVTALEVLEHLPAGIFPLALSELSRVARKAIVISVPWRERRRLIECKACGCRFNPSYHVRSFDEKNARGLIRGFSLVTTTLVMDEQYIGVALVAWVRSLIGAGEDLWSLTLCPQCGWRRSSPSSGRTQRSRVMGRRLWPKARAPRWAVLRFERDHRNGPCDTPKSGPELVETAATETKASMPAD